MITHYRGFVSFTVKGMQQLRTKLGSQAHLFLTPPPKKKAHLFMRYSKCGMFCDLIVSSSHPIIINQEAT